MGLRKPHTGELKVLVTFQTNSGKGSLGAGFLDGFMDLITVRCKKEPIRGDRSEVLGMVGIKKQYRIYCRFNPTIDNNDPEKLRCVIDAVVYTVEDHEYIMDGKKAFHVFTIEKFT